MSLREVNEDAKRRPQRPHWAQRWLRVIFMEDWGLKLLALAIALGLWYGVTGQRKPTTVRVPHVPLNFRLPADTEISNEPRTDVEITLTGSKRALDAFNVRDLVANVDVSDLTPGEHNVPLSADRVTMGLPDGVRFGDIQPGSLTLKLEPRVERELQVEVKYSGSVAEGYELQRVTASPDRVKVRGPVSHVNALEKAPTETVLLDGHKETFTLPQADIQIADHHVDLMDGDVSVTFEIGEQRVEKIFSGVAVVAGDGAGVTPGAASITVYGPRSAVNQLAAEKMRLVLDVAEDGSYRPRLEVPADLPGRVELRATSPSVFTRRALF
ncbi:MAG TPA: CdaR family protein [Pyrinomonadaceae bacterium]|nr:CdaR family protein [Pyrinomonadaceae bacterium]